MNASTIRKILGDLQARKGRTILVSLSIFIGVLGVVTLVSASDILINQLTKDIQTDELPMYNGIIGVTGDEVDSDPSTYLNILRQVQGVNDVEGAANYQIVWRNADETRFRKSYVYASTEPFGEIDLRPTRLMEGDYPQPDQYEIALEIRMAEKYEIEVGDTLDIRLPGGDIEKWTVTGLVFHPYDDQNYKNTMYANYNDALHLSGAPGLNMIYARFVNYATAERQSEALTSAIVEQTPYVVLLTLVDDPDESLQIEGLRDVTNVLTVLGITAMLVAGFLVINVVNNLVVEQRRQIGVMKSLGTTRFEALFIYGGIVMSYGVFGMIPGVLLGIPSGFYLADIVGDSAGTYITDFMISPLGIGLGILLGILVPVLSAAIPVLNGTRVSILEAMTDLGISGGIKVGPLANMVHTLPVSSTVKQALLNIIQKKGRLSLTVFTLMLAVASFMGVSAVFVSLDRAIDRLMDTFDYQIEVQPSSLQDFEATRTLLLENVPELENVYPSSGLSVNVEGYISPLTDNSQMIILGVETHDPLVNFDLREGDAWNNDPDREGIVLTTGAVEQMDKGIGDTVTLSLGGQTTEVEIIGITNFLLDAGFMRWQTLSAFAGFTENGTVAPNVMMLTTKDADPSSEEVEAILEDVDAVLSQNEIPATITNQVEYIETISQQVLSIGVILNLASLVMAAVGAIGLLTTLSIAVFERQKEIGIMRSVGATSPVIITQFMVEGVLVGALAWLAAVPLSFGLAYGINALLPFEDFIEFSFPVVLLPAGMVGILIVAIISSMWPSLVAARKTVSDILRYQ